MMVDAMRASLVQALPAGTPAADVIDYLDAQRLEHSGYVEGERRIEAIRRDADQSGMVSRALTIRFDFDRDRRLRTIAVRELFTGP